MCIKNKQIESVTNDNPDTCDKQVDQVGVVSSQQTESLVDIKPEAKIVDELNKGVVNVASFDINIEKKENKGEDANPIVWYHDGIYIVATFDGMGGSGATEYTTKNGTHTGAYIASRSVRDACISFFDGIETNIINIDDLSSKIKKVLDDCMPIYNIKPSGLRSAIIRILPTTLAIVSAFKKENKTHVMSYWCGDSRNYIMTESGLHQVSWDHLSKYQDPLENLRNDESLANCVCQDKPFTIDVHDCGTYTEPIIIISASDGCFGYLKSPMHFEHLLLSTLVEAESMDEWKCKIIDWLKPISGDDFSIGLMIVDNDFQYWKNRMRQRLELLEKEFIKPIQEKEEEIAKAEQDLVNKKSKLYELVTNLWKSYKSYFMPNRTEKK